MARLIVSVVVVVAAAGAGCEVRKQNPDNDGYSIVVDGTRFEAEFVADISEAARTLDLHQLDAVSAFDDRTAKRYDDAADIGIFARRLDDFVLFFTAPDEAGLGDVVVNRSELFRAGEPFVTFSRVVGGARKDFRPKDGQTVHLAVADGRLALSFDRLEMVDACDEPLLLEDGHIDARMLDSIIGDMPTLAELDVDPRQVEGSAQLVTDDGAFNDLVPVVAPPAAGAPYYDVELFNNCESADVVSLTISFDDGTQTAPGRYAASDLFIAGTTRAGDPANLQDDDQFLRTGGGTVDLVSLDDDTLALAITAPVDLVHMVPQGNGFVVDDTRHIVIQSGTVRSFIRR
jgi:hypothetical protein